MYASTSVKTVMLIAIASVLATGIELAGIDTLAAPRDTAPRQATVQLPTVVVSVPREVQATSEVRQLPRVVVTAQREATRSVAARQLPRVVVSVPRDTVLSAAAAEASASNI